jgi:glycosyltransferase involved in cell wall biosynthesis
METLIENSMISFSPKVFVSCFTYNHVKYIKETLDGFCMQQTSFPFVCGVVDDASTDGEQKVIHEYLEKHFDLNKTGFYRCDETDNYVRVFVRHKTNLNCFFAVVFLKYNHHQIKKSKIPYILEWRDRANYVAMCEGDDYWCDPTKLQKQVEIMEQNTECVLCHTSIRYYYEDIQRFIKSKDNIINSKYNEIKPTDVFKGYRIQYCTILYRRTTKEDIEMSNRVSRMPEFLMGDGQLYYEMAKRGRIVFIPKPLVVYRVHHGSASHQSIKPQLRFALSCAEMQLFYVKKDATDIQEIKYFQEKYDYALSQYLLWEPQYKPLFDSEQTHLIQNMSAAKRNYKKIRLQIRFWIKKEIGRIHRLFAKEI